MWTADARNPGTGLCRWISVLAGPRPLPGRRDPPARAAVLAYCGVRHAGRCSLTTENVAILFTDVVGSTELASSLLPDVADEVRRAHFAVLRQAIAETGGTEVKNLGDGLMVVFPVASSAILCAIAMQQGVDLHNRNQEQLVGLRVGLSGGEVSVEDGDYFGDPVVEAARLCALCTAGQVLATAIVRGMAGRRNQATCRPLGPLPLKGLPDPVETLEFLWEPALTRELDTVPLPPRVSVRPATGVVGRRSELDLVTDAVKQVLSDGSRRVLFVSGEPGVGKSTLVAEAARAAFEEGALVLFGHCEEDLTSPYQLFAEALTHLVTHIAEEELLAHVALYGSELARLVPALRSRVPDLPPSKATDPEAERFVLFAAVTALLASAARSRPVVLVFDDLQWADAGSLTLLAHLAGNDESARMLILGTYRDSETSRSPGLVEAVASLRRHGGFERIQLTGLDDAGVVAFMEASAGHDLDPQTRDLAQVVRRETDGNPFFVTEILRHLAETGVIGQGPNGHWTAIAPIDTLALPDSLRDIIRARVQRLGPPEGRLLTVAAVIGRDFDLDLLAAAAQVSEDEALDGLESAADVALVREVGESPGRYSFSHALIQHTLYESLGPTRRARLHRSLAEALEVLCQSHPGVRIGELARHWSAAQPADPVRAIEYSRQAGDAALQALAPDEAVSHYTRALDLCRDISATGDVAWIDMTIGLGIAQRQCGQPAYRQTLLDAAHRALECDETDRLVTAAVANSRGFFGAVEAVDTDKIHIMETALDKLAADDPKRALVLGALCEELTWDSSTERREELANEAFRIAYATGDDGVIVRVANSLFVPLFVPWGLEDSMTRTADALNRAERLGDPVMLFFAASWRAQCGLRAGDVTEMDRCLAIAGALAEQLDQATLNWTHTMGLGMRAIVAGDPDRVEQLANRAFEIGTEAGQPDAALYFGAQLVQVNLQRGTAERLVPIMEGMVTSTPGLSELMKSGLAVAYAEAGRRHDALQLLEASIPNIAELPLATLLITGLVARANAVMSCMAPQFARPVYERLVPWADQWSTVVGATTEGPVRLYLGGLATLLERYDEAHDHLARSASSCQGAGAPYYQARTDQLLGQMYLARREPGDLDRARQHLAAAQAMAAARGYGGVERDALEQLEAL